MIADDEMMIPARWPNGFLHDDSIYDRSVSWSEWDAGSVNGAAVDFDLDATGIDATGAIGIFNSGSWKSWARVMSEACACTACPCRRIQIQTAAGQ